MREQIPQERVKNFNEVPLGFNEQEAIDEARRCLQCKNPLCVSGCPAEVNIPKFIKAIVDKQFDQALAIIKETNNLPAVCGRVCPQEDQCEELCILTKKGCPINIGALERFAADWEYLHKKNMRIEKDFAHISKQKVAVIGSGPAGLTCAADLAQNGYQVAIFEALHKTGGVLRYGIPEFRLPKQIVDYEVESIRDLGVEIKVNYIIGKIKALHQLRQDGYKAFFIGTGAGLPYFLNVPGENLNGVYSANEFLTRVNLMKAYAFPDFDTPVLIGKKVAVIGAGNVSMDAARCALRLGSEKVMIVYRRTEDEMPARIDEIHHAKEEGIEFCLLSTPIEILGDENGNVRQMVCLKNELGEPDDSGRRRPIAVDGSNFPIDVDTVIVAIGNGPNPLLTNTIEGLKLDSRGNIVADNEARTNIDDIFAGGDIVSGSATVIAAMGAGKSAAKAIDAYLMDKVAGD